MVHRSAFTVLNKIQILPSPLKGWEIPFAGQGMNDFKKSAIPNPAETGEYNLLIRLLIVGLWSTMNSHSAINGIP